MITYHPNQDLKLLFQMFQMSCINLEILPRIIILADSFLYEIENVKGIVYKLNCHSNEDYKNIDKCIFLNELNLLWFNGIKFVKNPFICNSCINTNGDLYVNFYFTDVDVFCIHTFYFDDELLALII